MRDLAELRITDGGHPTARQAPTADAVASFQREFGLILPGEYLTLLRFTNGGHPELDTFVTPGDPNSNQWAVNRFFHLCEDRSAPDSLWVAMRRWRSQLGTQAVPFASDAGGNPFFLDLTETPPRVKACVHDNNWAIVDLAPTFGVFVDSLSVNPDYI